mmetsp:Transcript_21153/g.48985  ORF Transcript_21153/g.48985 Transcript_21153/m.48985 type:complete len:252 (-) Transcript_21153:823-1578(-)
MYNAAKRLPEKSSRGSGRKTGGTPDASVSSHKSRARSKNCRMIACTHALSTPSLIGKRASAEWLKFHASTWQSCVFTSLKRCSTWAGTSTSGEAGSDTSQDRAKVAASVSNSCSRIMYVSLLQFNVTKNSSKALVKPVLGLSGRGPALSRKSSKDRQICSAPETSAEASAALCCTAARNKVHLKVYGHNWIFCSGGIFPVISARLVVLHCTVVRWSVGTRYSCTDGLCSKMYVKCLMGATTSCAKGGPNRV